MTQEDDILSKCPSPQIPKPRILSPKEYFKNLMAGGGGRVRGGGGREGVVGAGGEEGKQDRPELPLQLLKLRITGFLLLRN